MMIRGRTVMRIGGGQNEDGGEARDVDIGGEDQNEKENKIITMM